MSKFFSTIIALLVIAGCASSTEFRTIPSGAKVWVDGELYGISPVSYYDRYPAGASVKVNFTKKGYEDREVEITKNCLYVHRIFWFPVLSWPWITGYRDQYTFELYNKEASQAQEEHGAQGKQLKESGIRGAIPERPLSGVVSEARPARSAVSPTIALITKEKTLNIAPISGQFKSATIPMFGFRRFVEFPISATATRVKERFPTLLLNVDSNPHEALWLVKLKPWQDNDSLVLDLISPSIWEGQATSNDPDESCNIQYSAIEDKPGLWRITPKEGLEPGDYGLFRWAWNNPYKPLLVGFGID